MSHSVRSWRDVYEKCSSNIGILYFTHEQSISINRRNLMTADVDKPYCRCGDKQYSLRKRGVAP